MKKRTHYDSVSDMVRGLSEDRTFADELERQVSKRELIKALMVLRTKAGMSQQELAQKLGCTQSKVSKLESSNDEDLRFSDLVTYTEAVGCEMRILLVPRGQKLTDDVRMHAGIIQRLLNDLVQLAGDDSTVTKAMGNFLKEAAFNLTKLVKEAAADLPPVRERAPQPVQVEATSLEEDDRLPGGREAVARAEISPKEVCV